MKPGTVLRERWEIVSVLAENRAAVTCLATDRATGRPCVVKALPVSKALGGSAEVSSYEPGDFTKVLDLFEREARVLANIDHPGVPALLDHFAEDTPEGSVLYTVQAHAPGRTLADLVRGGRHFSEAEARAVCRRVAEVLSYLHDRSPPLVHRDIKPSNVLLDDDGAVHLVDFGAVKNLVGGDDLGGATIVGTYGYMPMEQYEGRAIPASDVYSLGVTLLHLLSHRSPTDLPRDGLRIDFRGAVAVSDGFAAVLERMVEPDPASRYRDGSALLSALDDLERGRLARRPPAGAVADARRRSVLVAGAGLAAAGTGLAVVMMSAGDAPLPADAPPTPVERPVRTSGGPVEGEVVVDAYADFRYSDRGFPMGLSVGQSSTGPLEPSPVEDLANRPAGDEVLYGWFPLGNGPDRTVAFALVRRGSSWALHVDRNDDEDLGNDGPPLGNQGDGTLMAAEVTVQATVVDASGEATARPYNLWTWFRRDPDTEAVGGGFYARHHWRGTVTLGGEDFVAVAFERQRHDALLKESGLCIDLDRNDECADPDEIYFDGDVVRVGGLGWRLRLDYP